LVIPS